MKINEKITKIIGGRTIKLVSKEEGLAIAEPGSSISVKDKDGRVQYEG